MEHVTPLVDPTFTYGAIVSIIITLMGFGCTMLYQAFKLGSYAASNAANIQALHDDMIGMREEMKELKDNSKVMTQVLVDVAKSRTEINLLSERISDVQRHGSHRLAEIMAGWRADQK